MSRLALGKHLLIYSSKDPKAGVLTAATAEWGCVTAVCASLDELRGRLEGSDHDYVLVEPSAALRRLVTTADEEHILQMPLAEVEKHHIMRVLASTKNNKTRAAKLLGIDTKTLYNKLKSYQAAEQVARKRAANNGSLSEIV